MPAFIFSRILVVLVVLLIYALWVIIYLWLERRQRKDNKEKPVFFAVRKEKKDIVGKSRYVLGGGQTQQEAATGPQSESPDQNPGIFASENKKGHPRIPPEELDRVFNEPPQGETNEPLQIYVPLYDEKTEDEEADENEDYFEDTDEAEEAIPLQHAKLARGVRFEQLGEAYHTVVHYPDLTRKEKEDTGRILTEMKHTDMFEAVVSSHPEGENRVTYLIDTYLDAFYAKIAASMNESPTQRGVPSDFNIRDFIP